MKKRLTILISIFAFAVSANAQIESNKDSISIRPNHPLDQFGDLQNSENVLEVEKSKRVLSPQEVERRKEFVKAMHFTTPEFYVGPATEDKPYGRVLPFVNDYVFYDYHQLTDDMSLITRSSQDAYMTIGSIRRVDAYINYQPTNWLSISGGVYGAKYNLYGEHFNDMGASAALSLKVHDRIYLKGYGSYAPFAESNLSGMPQAGRGLFPSTYFGGGVEFKVTKKVGIEGGMIREKNPFNGKWQNTPYIMPVFHLFGR